MQNTISSLTLQNTLVNWFKTDDPILNYVIVFCVISAMSFFTQNGPALCKRIWGKMKLVLFPVPDAPSQPSLMFTASFIENGRATGQTEFFAWLHKIREVALPPFNDENRIVTKDDVIHLEKFGQGMGYNNTSIWIPDRDVTFPLEQGIYVEFRKTISTDGDDKSNKKRIDLSLKIFVRTPEEMPKLLTYHETLVCFYMEYTNRNCKDPHIWRLKSCNGNDNHWTAFTFNSTRTFDHVWFKEKQSFLDAYRRFRNNKDAYRESGDPWFFSTLFYGPPGCGKTSTIKALLEETRRLNDGKPCHLLVVPFKEIKSGEELMRLLHSPYLNNMTIPFDQRIYIFEDFDAENGADMLKKKNPFEFDGEYPDMYGGFGPHTMHKKFSKREKKSSRSKKSFQKNENTTIFGILADDKDSSFDIVESSDDEKKEERTTEEKDREDHEARSNAYHRFSLSEILNAIDGVQELHGHTLIFTTNCPTPRETFDSAFIREGRMHHIIELGRCNVDGINYFFKKAFGMPCPDDVVDKLGNHVFTPAKVKSACKRFTGTSDTRETMMRNCVSHLLASMEK